ncbi:uncharacterized protein B0I36DRAFT_381822 [Microdochium trichocladiopsis]|uniref:tyrosinase n=1 Tax=Microdochium trichocladiopsis TaxID=1682393 RepID=A0A9P8YAV9_9PEZI|nr:uncharacterized protein B0I36DRAFT_381822 [Microdochium trichocladiopsis]KAH7035016.1 hypothetical protein B0I36DRAFT_381822 [Microdochium trichocladiopsis]
MRPVSNILLLLPLLVSYPVRAAHTHGKYDFGQHAEYRLRERHDQLRYSTYVTPLPLVGDKPVLRRELRDFYRDKDSWTLYILALNWIQYTPQDSLFSHYQLAAIHGSPGLTWGDVDSIAGSENIGYCTHVSVLFPTWHRPYMALYEQTLYNLVQSIAELWPEDELEHWRETARRFRIPYWDWGRVTETDKNVFPDDIAGQRGITAYGPNGDQAIANPLYSYIFQPFNASIFPASPWNTWTETKRAPQPMVETDAVSNNSFVARSFELSVETYQQRLYNLLAHYDNYSAFSNEGWITNSANFTQDSIESLHDSIHIAAGGYFGHLAIIGFSAFDPFFWLHHVNMDRIIAMWQVLNPDSFVVRTPAVYATHTSKAGEMQDSTTALTPFRQNASSFWTSDTVRDHEVFGYTYEEVMDKDRNKTATWVNKLYTAFSPVSMRFGELGQLHAVDDAEPARLKLGPEQLKVVEGTAGDFSRTMHPGIPKELVSSEQNFTDWLANVRANKRAYGCSYTVYLFWDTIPSDVSSWPVAVNLVGSLGIFGTSEGAVAGSSPQLVSGVIPLTSAIMRRMSQGHIDSLRKAEVDTHLKTRLKHGIALANGTIVTYHDWHQVSITVFTSTIRAPRKPSELARYIHGAASFTLPKS